MAIDVETGGTTAGVHALLAIGARSEFGEEYSAYVLPVEGALIEEEAARVNGYTPELWAARGARDALTVALEFAGWLDWVRGKHGLDHWGFAAVAHNAGFDKGFLEWLQRITGCDFGFNYRWECSQSLLGALIRAGVFPEEVRSASLDSLCKLTWIGGRPEVHDAVWDARACLKGYTMLLGLVHGFAAAVRGEAMAAARPATLQFVKAAADKALAVELKLGVDVESGFDVTDPVPKVAPEGAEPRKESLRGAEEWEHEYKLDGVAGI
jgi:DNA polymerase III epsilon subunit-like protein